jgi:hypothetical protein
MLVRVVQNFTCDRKLLDYIRAFSARAVENPDVASALNIGLALVAEPPDKWGLIDADYDALRTMTKSKLDGEALILKAIQSCRQAANGYMRAAVKRNRRKHPVNISRVIEALIVKGLESVEHAAVETGPGAGRNAGKTSR